MTEVGSTKKTHQYSFELARRRFLTPLDFYFEKIPVLYLRKLLLKKESSLFG